MRAEGIGIEDLADDELAYFGRLLSQRPRAGIRFSGTGQVVSPAQAMRALERGFAAAGGKFEQGRARAIEVDAGTASALLDDGRHLYADMLVVAAGVDSRVLMESAGHFAPVAAERGYHVHWPDHQWPSGMPPVVFEDRSIILSRFNDGLRLAGFTEFARTATPADARKWAALRAHAASLGIPTRGEGGDWLGSRPTLPDYLPAIGRSPRAHNLLYAFGHQHLGLTLAPITAEIIVHLAAASESPIPLAPFDLQRFTNRGNP